MKFIKGMSEGLLWRFLCLNIFDYFDGLVDYSKQNIIEKIFSKEGTLKKDVEIIVKINGKVQPDVWKK